MAGRRRPTQNTHIARGLGGRTGFASEELDRGAAVPPWEAGSGSRAERKAAGRNWHDAINHFEDYDDGDVVRTTRLRVSVDWVIAIGAVVFFFGPYLAFIAFLAMTR